jgi:outer membrane protein
MNTYPNTTAMSATRQCALKCLLALVALASLHTANAESKVAFVSTEKILKESVVAQEAQKTLASEFSRRETSLADMATDLKRKSDKLDRDGFTMSATERQRLQADLSDQDTKFQRERRNLEEEIQARRNQLLSNILERANREIIRIAESEKIDIVFQDAVWASPKIDITAKVLDALKK